MKKTYGTLAALSALTASLAVAPTGADANKVPAGTPMAQVPPEITELATDVDRLRNQCDYIWENRTNVAVLTAELNRLLNYGAGVRTCTDAMSPEMRRSCEEECTGLIVSLLGGDPVAQIGGGTQVVGDENDSGFDAY